MAILRRLLLGHPASRCAKAGPRRNRCGATGPPYRLCVFPGIVMVDDYAGRVTNFTGFSTGPGRNNPATQITYAPSTTSATALT